MNGKGNTLIMRSQRNEQKREMGSEAEL